MTLIRLAGAGKTFPGGVEALRDVDLEVAAGEFVSFIGPSGSGKSTLLRIVGGLIPSDTGTVTVGEGSPGAARARKQFGFVPQRPALLPWRTVRANVRLLTEVNRRQVGHALPTDAQVDELLESVGLAPFRDAYPRQLSGGMQQRVALVRAFALGAPILLMDEPFAALDEITRAEMRYLLLEVWQRIGNTVLFVTHSIPEAVALSDRVIVLTPRPGMIAAIETITLPRPRRPADEDSDRFHEHVRNVRQALHLGGR